MCAAVFTGPAGKRTAHVDGRQSGNWQRAATGTRASFPTPPAPRPSSARPAARTETITLDESPTLGSLTLGAAAAGDHVSYVLTGAP